MRWNGMIIANMEFISVIGMAPTIYVDAVKVVSKYENSCECHR